MGNPNSKKKAKVNFISNHHSKKVKALWNIGHVDKLKQAGQKQVEQSKLTVHFTTSQHYQENVFIEGNRPKYLEDLHIEAQEGLKMLQQEENNIGTDLEVDEPVFTASAQQENEFNYEERARHQSFDSTTDRLSTGTSGPVLTCQGSTFKPLNTVKRLDSQKKRIRRTTIMGIPQQVQRELCMKKGALLQLPSNKDSDLSGEVIIPSIDGEGSITNHEGARVHLQDIEALQMSKDDQFLSHHIHMVYSDDFLNAKSGTQMFQRPRSLAVPGITTYSALLKEPQGPVMSISPQATYLSTIIPNAILPSAIDVIEIDRSCNQRSAGTANKGILAPANPASSNSGGGTPDEPYSTSSKLNHSQSSETIVSHPSTISFKGSMFSSHVSDSMKSITDLNEEQMSLKSLISCSSSTSKAFSPSGDPSDPTETSQKLFSHNRSVVKAKLPPAPPQRTYSLHQEKLQKPNELASTKDLKGLGANKRQLNTALYIKEDPTSSYTENISTQSLASQIYDNSILPVTSKPHKSSNASESNNSSPQDIFERTLSPSSGYSSQSGTPTHSSKDNCPSSPRKQKLKPPKPERIRIQISPAVSVSSSLVSLSSSVSDPNNHLTYSQMTQSQPAMIILAVQNKVPPPTTTALRDLFNIPPPPKVKAPCPPPPETWVHNERTTELLCGHRLYGPQKHQTNITLTKNQTTVDTTKLNSRQISGATVTNGIQSENKSAMCERKDKPLIVQEQVLLDDEERVRNVVQESEHNNLEEINNNQKSKAVSEKLISADKLTQTLLLEEKFISDSYYAPSGGLPHKETKETYNIEQKIFRDKTTNRPDVEGFEATLNSQSLCLHPEHFSPSGTKISSCSVSVQTQYPETEKELLTLEPSWPPPPPPIDESSDLILEGQDAIDFPPPPPPDMQESFIVMSEHHQVQSSGYGNSMDAEKSHDLTNPTEKNSQIIPSTTSELEMSNEPLPVVVVELASSKASVPVKMSLNLKDMSLQETALPPQNDLLSSPVILQKSLQAPTLSNDLKNIPSFPIEEQPTVHFKRHPSQISKDSKSKGHLTVQKCAPIPKEEANIPLITSSLLQMVRLQTVNVENQVDLTSQKGTISSRDTSDQNLSVCSQVTPQKPIRKSCIKSTSSPVKSSMRLQEAIRMKTAAMSSSAFPPKPSLQLSTTNANSNDVPVPCSKTLDDCKSPASTASFIFSKSTKKVVIETATSLEAQTSLKQSLAAELMQVYDEKKATVTNGTKKHHKVPPPVARKPVCTTYPSEKAGTVPKLTIMCSSGKPNNGVANNQASGQYVPVTKGEEYISLIDALEQRQEN